MVILVMMPSGMVSVMMSFHANDPGMMRHRSDGRKTEQN